MASWILAFIERQRLGRRSRLPSERELAQLSGASPATVNRAVVHLIASGQLRREGYKLYPDKRTGTGESQMVLPVTVWGPAAVAEGAGSALRALGARPVLECERWMQPGALVHWLVRNEGRCAGLIVAPRVWDEGAAMLEAWRSNGVPVVGIGAGSAAISWVGTDAERELQLAVEYLVQCGHRQIVLLMTAVMLAQRRELERAVRQREGEDRRRGVQVRLAVVTTHSHQDLDGWVAGRDTEETACVCANDFLGAALVRALTRNKQGCPGALSVVALGENRSARRCRPELTTVAAPGANSVGLWAAQLLVEEMRMVQAGKPMPEPQVLKFQPRVFERQSVVRRGEGAMERDRSGRMRTARWASDMLTRRSEVVAMWAEPHRAADKMDAGRFETVDLSRWANRSLSRMHGWLGGLPLLHFPPGLRTIHGVPFRVMDEKRNRGRAAVVMRSARAGRQDKTMPERIVVPVPGEAAGLYLLYGAGWTHHARVFGRFGIRDRAGTEHWIEWRAPGLAAGVDPAEYARRCEAATVQDWWPEEEPLRNGRCLPVVVCEDGDPLNYERYLYTLEWSWAGMRTLEALILESDPRQEATLGLLAVTVAR